MILVAMLVYIAFGYICAAPAKERTASLVVLPPLVLGYDELYADQNAHSKETIQEENSPSAMRGVGDDLVPKYSLLNSYNANDEDFLNAELSQGNGLNTQNDGHQSVTDQRYYNRDGKSKNCNRDLREVDIVGKMVLPQNLVGCN